MVAPIGTGDKTPDNQAEAMSGAYTEPVPMQRADMVMLESAIRNGWPVPDRQLRDQLRRFQAVLDDHGSSDRARWRARRVLELAQSRLDGGKTEQTHERQRPR